MVQDTEKIILNATKRSGTGKDVTHALRREGFIPGVVYGESIEPYTVQVSDHDLSQILRSQTGESVLVTLSVSEEGGQGKEEVVLIKEVQQHAVTHDLLHVDFHQVDLTKKVTVTVPLAFNTEETKGVKEQGGILDTMRRDVDVICLPTEIPAEIVADITELDLGETLHAGDIAMPEGIELAIDAEISIIACVAPRVKDVDEEEAEGEETEPEVISEKKDDAPDGGDAPAEEAPKE